MIDFDYIFKNDILDIEYYEEENEKYTWCIYTKQKFSKFHPGDVLVAEIRENGNITCWEEFDNIYVKICEKFNINVENKNRELKCQTD